MMQWQETEKGFITYNLKQREKKKDKILEEILEAMAEVPLVGKIQV